MNRQFCDRCAKDVTGMRTGAIHGVSDADERGDGAETDNFDHLCVRCYRELLAFIKSKPKAKK